jgi:GMP synthase (glutamine-hydrolysing)
MDPSTDSRAGLSFLLLQARNLNDLVRNEERDAFATQLGVRPGQVKQLDILNDDLDLAMTQDVDAVLVGGAGEFGVVNPHPPVQRMIRFLVGAAEADHPIFASCFGFQALVVGLGGEVVEDEENSEVGTYELQSTESAAKDPVFSALPLRFKAQLGHKDRAVKMPTGVTNLVSSERCPYQALHIPGTSVYATQFHPELTWLDNRLRFERYMDQYGRLFGEEGAQRRLDAHEPGPEANELLGRFVDICLLGGRK